MKLEELRKLSEKGYKPIAPLGDPLVKEDEKNSKSWVCIKCGHIGMIYTPYTRKKDYRAFMVCPNCDWVSEV